MEAPPIADFIAFLIRLTREMVCEVLCELNTNGNCYKGDNQQNFIGLRVEYHYFTCDDILMAMWKWRS